MAKIDGKEKLTTKAKGFTLDGVTSQFINFVSMELLVNVV